MVPLTPEADAIVERRKAQTGVTKQIIVDRLIKSAGRRWFPPIQQEDKP